MNPEKYCRRGSLLRQYFLWRNATGFVIARRPKADVAP